MEGHHLFRLTGTSNWELSIFMYDKLEHNLFEITVLKLGILNTKEPSELLDNQHNAKLPGSIDWNLMRLASDVFESKYSSQFLLVQWKLLHCCFHNSVSLIIIEFVKCSQLMSINQIKPVKSSMSSEKTQIFLAIKMDL